MWEKEKLLVTSNFSVSYIVFKGHELQTRKNQGLFGKGLKLKAYKLFENSDADLPWLLFLTLSETSPGFYVSAA